MDVILSAKEYCSKMVTIVSGLKALLLDDETSGIVGMVYSRSNVLEKDVFFMDLLSNKKREEMHHLKGVVFVRPTVENINLLAEELRAPRYSEYHIFFSNIVSRPQLHQLALADGREAVKQVQEFYGDFYAVNHELFSLNLPSVAPLLTGDDVEQRLFTRVAGGLVAALLAVRRRPAIRYQASSALCARLAAEVRDRVAAEAKLFGGFARSDHTLLLVLDRREDPVTPLLTQWTYQAMVHELLGLKNNRVRLSCAAAVVAANADSADPTTAAEEGGKKDASESEVVLSCGDGDSFFQQNMFRNWGDLCMNVKVRVDELKAKSDRHSNVQSIEDIKNLMKDLPAFRSMGTNVTKHVNLVSDIGECIDKRDLLTISVLEQEIACYQNHAEHYERVMELMQNPKIQPEDLLRLVMIYALRYEKRKEGNALAQFRELLRGKGLPASKVAEVDALLRYAGGKARSTDLLFHNLGSSSVGLNKIITNLAKGFKDVRNVYTQHEPVLKPLLLSLAKGTASLEAFPYISGYAHSATSSTSGGGAMSPMNPPGPLGNAASTSSSSSKWKPKEIIVFIVGGATFEEALFVNAINDPTNPLNATSSSSTTTSSSASASSASGGSTSSNSAAGRVATAFGGGSASDLKCLLGGTTILNSKMFLQEVVDCNSG